MIQKPFPSRIHPEPPPKQRWKPSKLFVEGVVLWGGAAAAMFALALLPMRTAPVELRTCASEIRHKTYVDRVPAETNTPAIHFDELPKPLVQP